MSDPTPKPGILGIDPYAGGESALDGLDKVIKLSSNESAFGPSPKAVAAYTEAGANLHRYPDGGCTDLRNALAALHRLDAARIVCGAGSDELISLLCQAYAGPGDEVLYSEHGFLMYPISAKASATMTCWSGGRCGSAVASGVTASRPMPGSSRTSSNRMLDGRSPLSNARSMAGTACSPADSSRPAPS